MYLKAGVDDGLVFFVQRVGERHQVGFLVLVVLDLGARERACRRDDREEAREPRVLALRFGDACFQVGDIAGYLLLGIFDRTVDDDAIAEPLGKPGGRVIFGVELGERRMVAPAAHRRHRIGHFFGGRGTYRDAAKPLEDVEGPVDALGEFAVADDIDADIGLLTHNLGDGFGEAGFKGCFIVRLAIFDGAPEFDQLRRPNKAADVGGENAIGAVRHGWSSLALIDMVCPSGGVGKSAGEVLCRPKNRLKETVHVTAGPCDFA